MPKAELQATLERLRAELDDPSALDEATRQQLEDIRDEIETVLELTAEARRERQPVLQGRLAGALDAFGAEHPALTRALGALLDTLTSIGL